jgi:hypothetical protein
MDDFIKSEDLHNEVSEKLDTKYLSTSTHELDEVKGKFFGDYKRPYGVMTMRIKGQIKNVHFLIVQSVCVGHFHSMPYHAFCVCPHTCMTNEILGSGVMYRFVYV